MQMGAREKGLLLHIIHCNWLLDCRACETDGEQKYDGTQTSSHRSTDKELKTTIADAEESDCAPSVVPIVAAARVASEILR
jgi:hypothetical protein